MIYSDIFTIPVDNEDGPNTVTRWQMMAFTKTNDRQHYMAFRLISHNEICPKDKFHFEYALLFPQFITMYLESKRVSVDWFLKSHDLNRDNSLSQ